MPSPRAGGPSSCCALPAARRGGRRRNSSWRRTRGCAPGSSGCCRSGSGETSWKAGRWQHLDEPPQLMALLTRPRCGCSCWCKIALPAPVLWEEQKSQAGLGAGRATVLTIRAAAPTELPAPPQSNCEQRTALLRRGNRKKMKLEANSAPLQHGNGLRAHPGFKHSPDEGMSPGHSLHFSPNSPQAEI